MSEEEQEVQDEQPATSPPAETAGDLPDPGSHLPSPPPPSSVPVLQKLSTPPFPRTGFPLLGVLASIYEHVVAVGVRMKQNGSQQQP